MAGNMTAYEGSPQDEGYSEDPLTIANSATLPPWVQSMSAVERTEYVMNIISHLPTSQVADIVSRLRPRLYINFFNYLPPEVCLKVLGFLDPASLINTARASREWMALAMDRKLWEQLYILEGFRVITSEVERFEASLNVGSMSSERSRPSGHTDDEHASKRRATPQRILPSLQTDVDSDMPDADAGPKQVSIFGGQMTKEPLSTRGDVDVPMTSPRPSFSRTSQFSTKPVKSVQSRSSHRTSTGSTAPILTNISSLVVEDPSDKRRKLNWQYLYSQRRRLEANWENEKYINFQLPHPAHPEEAHEECIYTIQHSGKYLVSGSRDKTLRIWDLDTRRLIRPPLRAHAGSVLCLQFDADPEEDLIVSGSSDATIVLWKFSTGQVIQRLRKAHRESVLNVRFDKRVLVTCSKDKTIKVFNRRDLNAGDLGYPGYSGVVHPVPTFLNNYGYNPAPSAGLPVKPAYSMIGCLEGHGAAVNAVQIYGNEVVSASGDRTVKVWNWPEQTCTRTLIGHTKGIACVQYDGRRIVSGSSDNEVKVFDKESGLEVASLRAHSNLVRTVQAGFGDLPYSAEEDQEDARAIDHEYFKAVDSGAISRTVYLQRGRPRNAGSRRPEDITAYGAKLPPGGGGGRFGRIVSGSYDETIIIWRRDKEGVWRAQHTLRQEEAAQAASRAVEPQPVQPTQPVVQSSATPSIDVDAPTQPFPPGSDQFYHHLIDTTIPQGPMALQQALQNHPQLIGNDYLMHTIRNLPTASEQVMTTIINDARQAQVQLPAVAGPSTSLSQPGPSISAIHNMVQQWHSSLPLTTTNTSSSSSGPSHPLQATQTPSSTPLPQIQPLTQTQAQTQAPAPAPAAAVAAAPAPAPHHHHGAGHHHVQANMARVFKLQFDARRIICCSQTSTIVGWDFANNDAQIIEASRFFAPIE
ncbi:WD40-repeat-containing domain protein [Cadophora sp. MPI-SDFR-AT-0126]|nr:WD40-repeat-containing domain protein [Leotiomycetes sp. MPI-SDFR-AT-0126]